MKKRGFTLIELLVVIAIIGVLSSVILVSLNTARGKARDAQREQIFHNIQTALNIYYSDNGSYPSTGGSWSSQCSSYGAKAPDDVIPGLVPTYISSIPADPAQNITGNQNCFLYISKGTGYKFLDYNLSDAQNPGGPTTLIDPERNVGRAWANNSACPTATITSISWAIWSDSSYMCY